MASSSLSAIPASLFDFVFHNIVLLVVVLVVVILVRLVNQ